MAKKIKIPLEILNLQEDGYHLFISAEISDHPVRMLLDTGASRTVLDKNFLNEKFPDLKLETNEQPATGAGSNSIQSEIGVVTHLKIGDFKLSNYTIAVLDMKHVNETYDLIGMPSINGVIGSDILVAHEAVLNLKKRRLSLKSPGL